MALLPVLILCSCAAVPVLKVADPSNPINTVAVLPVYNTTNDLDGPTMVRGITVAQLTSARYSVMPVEDVDMTLKEQMGVTLGEQLDLTTPQALGEYLGVDAVMYIYLLNFDDKTTGVYNVKRARAGLKLVDSKTGRPVWAKGQGVKSVVVTGKAGELAAAIADQQDKKERLEEYSTIKGIADIPNLTDWWSFPIEKIESKKNASLSDMLADAAASAIISVGEKIVTKAMGIHLRRESDKMLDLIFSEVSHGPGRQVYGVSYLTVPPTMPNAAKYDTPGSLIVDYIARGKGEFNAELYLSLYKDGKLDAIASGRVLKAGSNFLCEIDMTAYVAGKKDVPKALARAINIRRFEDGRILNLYPMIKKYYERAATESDRSGPRVDSESAGEEVIDTHKCVKRNLRITSNDGRTITALSYEAKDLEGFPLKVEFEESGIKGVMEFKNVFMSAPSASEFQVATGYEKSFKFDHLQPEDAVQKKTGRANKNGKADVSNEHNDGADAPANSGGTKAKNGKKTKKNKKAKAVQPDAAP